MIKISTQSPSSIVMIRPHHFTINVETAIDNAFQVRKIPQKELGNSAYQEITEAAKILSNHGIKVHIFENKTLPTFFHPTILTFAHLNQWPTYYGLRSNIRYGLPR